MGYTCGYLGGTGIQPCRPQDQGPPLLVRPVYYRSPKLCVFRKHNAHFFVLRFGCQPSPVMSWQTLNPKPQVES